MEKSIRKQWLISFWLYYSMTLIWVLPTAVAPFFILHKNVKEILLASVIFLILSSFSLIPMLITYHCAYRKRGTAWLLWLLIIIPIYMALLFISFLQAEMKTGLNFSGWVLLYFLPTIFFWVSSFRLRKVNKIHRVTEKHWEVIKQHESPL
jgi:hypothetical protein